MMRRGVFLIGIFVLVYGVPLNARGAESKSAVIASGDSHSCAVTPDRKAVCWGNNRYGQLGNGTTADAEAPVVVSGLSNVEALAAGDGHTCAALATGQVKCWGRNDLGQLADLTKHPSSKPVLTPVGPATLIAAGRNHTCARLIDGEVVCWGDNRTSQTGIQRPSLAKPSLPVVVPGVSRAISIAAGAEHSCAVQEDGQLLCWGDNHYGQLGHGILEPHSFPPGPVPIAGKAVAVTAGRRHTCALLRDGTVQCWGEGFEGQLGDGLRKSSLTPVRVVVPGPGGKTVPLDKVAAISAGSQHTCAILESREVYCWGSNSLGQLGAVKDKMAATPVFSGLTGVVALGAGGSHTCAILSSGGTKCLGPIETPQVQE
jgi:alpha-tubulin suppressor-like RCC1 family protein